MKKIKFSPLKLIVNITLVLCSASVSGALMTVEEFERKQLDIMQSQLEKSQKVEEIKHLIELYKVNEELSLLINPPEVKEVDVPTEVEVQSTKAITSSELQDKQGDRIKRMRELIATNDSGMYMTEYFSVGNFIQATFIVNGKVRKDVDVKAAIETKKQFGNYRILKIIDTDVVVLNTRTNTKNTLVLQSPTEVLNDIEFANEVTREYAKSIIMGELDVDLQNQNDAATNTLPLDVGYPTMSSAPTPFDSMAK